MRYVLEQEFETICGYENTLLKSYPSIKTWLANSGKKMYYIVNIPRNGTNKVNFVDTSGNIYVSLK